MQGTTLKQLMKRLLKYVRSHSWVSQYWPTAERRNAMKILELIEEEVNRKPSFLDCNVKGNVTLKQALNDLFLLDSNRESVLVAIERSDPAEIEALLATSEKKEVGMHFAAGLSTAPSLSATSSAIASGLTAGAEVTLRFDSCRG